MKKRKYFYLQTLLLYGIAAILFCIPFFWLKPGYVDLGGDNGRLYFIQPLWVIHSILQIPDLTKIYWFALIPYIFFVSLLKFIIQSPTALISFEHGMQLSLAFLCMYSCSREIIKGWCHETKRITGSWISMVGGIVYVSFIYLYGWQASLYTQNQIFINPLLFFLLLRYMLTQNMVYGLGILGVTILYSANFGFGSFPQLFSFFPLSCLFIMFYIHFLLRKQIPWKGLAFITLCFIGLHAFHLLPLTASLFDKGGTIRTVFFSGEAIGNRGVHYFDLNHKELGKISLQLFQPSQWHGQNVLILLVPFISFLGFLKKPSKLLILLGVFFAVTLFLVSANITSLGVQLYRSLFYIPGFMMVRSFYEKWYFVNSFFFSLLFTVSFYYIFIKKSAGIVFLLGLCVLGSVGYRIYPFLQGKAVNTILWQSKNVASTLTIDPDLMEAITFVRTLSDDGNVLTLPLTFPHYQVAYGKEGGAYVGVSMVQFLGGKKDFPGFALFGPYQKYVFDSLRVENIHDLLQFVSLLNIRYIFHNSDSRIMDNFPGFPYVYPGELYSSKDAIPSIKNQTAYTGLFNQMPLKSLFNKGFYHIYEIDKTVIRPAVYIPDAVYSSSSGVVSGSSFRSSYGDEMVCKRLESFNLPCDGMLINEPLPDISFTKKSKTTYDVTIDLKERKEPFLVILSEDYHTTWEMNLDGKKNTSGVPHIRINGYANAWIIEPKKIGPGSVIHGFIQLGFQRYYTYGWMISGITAVLLVIGVLYIGVRRRYEKK